MKSAVVFALLASLATPSVSFAGQVRPGQSWSEVHRWKPGWEVTAWTTTRSDSRRGYIISTDDTGMLLLNVSGVELRADVIRTLRHAIVEHPDYFPVADGVTLRLDDRVSLTSVGLFVADQKVAEYDQIVERIARTDVDAGTVVLDVKKEWSKTRQILVTVGLIYLAGAVIIGIACASKGCD
jgi:hypothetical protein